MSSWSLFRSAPAGFTSILIPLSVALATPAAALDDGHHHPPPSLLPDLSGLHFPVTASAEAQRYVDQGMELAWGFNHQAALEAFTHAAELDAECGMCWWGQALVLGPNINAPMEADAVPSAWRALQNARRLAPDLTAHEQAYIEALGTRYSAEPMDDRSTLDQAYAKAMRRLSARHPDDLHAATLYAEALMDTTPWDYWTDDDQPRAVTTEFLRVLEGVLKRDPGHVGANHLLIHAVEKVRPDLGIPSAERLETLSEGAGHLVHMGAHIFIRVGRYADAMRVNEKAIAADLRFAENHQVSTTYGFLYGLHNRHFLAAAAAFAGDGDRARSAALELQRHVDAQQMRQPGMLTGQHYWVTPFYTAVRFGDWQWILDQPSPDQDLLYPRAVWHWARGMAFARTSRLDDAENELTELRRFAEDRRLDSVTVWDLNTTRTLMQIAERVLTGETMAARGQSAPAIVALEQAVEIEDRLTYDEPPAWPIPVRHHLGAVLLEADQAQRAEGVFRENLHTYPLNPWALVGLRRALASQQRTDESVEAQLAQATDGLQRAPVNSRW